MSVRAAQTNPEVMSSSVTYTSIFSVQNVIIGPATTLALTVFIAGFYTLLYGLSTYLLIKRRSLVLKKKVHLVWTTAVFFISTLGALTAASNYIVDATYYYEAVKTQDLGPLVAYSTGGRSQTAMAALTYVCYIISNCIADGILIHRCYILYGSRKALFGVLIFLSFSTNGVVAAAIKLKGQTSGLIDQSNWAFFLQGTNLQVAYYCVNAGVNGCLTLILAGRIWWMGQQTREYLGPTADRRYRAVAAVILESGITYPMVLIVQAVMIEKTSKIGVPMDFTPMAMLTAGIAPTLINVRISIGRSVETSVYQNSMVRHDSNGIALGSLKVKRAESQTMSERSQDVEQRGHGYPQTK
uniref:Uncharacterized protein n=1 Tax=Moniliophthora roreri TaxID=221103 RepID=A0A0W0G9H2_MONRR